MAVASAAAFFLGSEMALIDMMSEMTDEVPGLDRPQAKKYINRAWRVVEDSCLWSFQLGQGGFSTPNVTTAGSISAALNSNQITGDLNATIAWNALPFYWTPTIQQIRANGFSIYSIIAQGGNGSIAYGTTNTPGSGQTPGTYVLPVTDSGGGSGATATVVVAADGTVHAAPVITAAGANYVNPSITLAAGGIPANFSLFQFAVLTLDRNFVDPLPFFTGVGYQMFLQYIAAPPRFKRWFTIADMFNCWALDIWTGKRTVDLTDPARLYTSNPACAIGFGQDKRGQGTTTPSATLGQELYELYPTPQTQISYQTYFAQYSGPLSSNSDTLPFPIDEEVVLWRAKVYGYQWAESRKDVMAAKGSGANYLALKKEANAEFYARLKTLRLQDRDAVDSYMVNMKAALSGFRGFGMPYFNALSGTANMGIGGWQ